MTRLNRLWRNLTRRQEIEQDLDDEMRQTLAMLVAERVRAGMPAEEATRKARLVLNGVESVKEQVRATRSGAGADAILRDVRYSLRGLRRNPGLSLVIVLTLTLGIGANTAIFSILNGAILSPLGYTKPEQLIFLSTRVPALGLDKFWLSPPEYMEFREINQSFSNVGAYTVGEVNVFAGVSARRVRSAAVDDHLLSTLGVRPAYGRLFDREETVGTSQPVGLGQLAPGTARVVILSHELWQTAYGGRPVVGEVIQVDGVPNEVVGIMPPGVDVMDNRTEIWLPLGLNPSNRQNRATHMLSAIGRLKERVTPEAAQSELDALMENWGQRVGVSGPGVAGHVPIPASRRVDPAAGVVPGHVLQMAPIRTEIIGASAARSIWVLQAAVGLVLLIACANLASLLLARAETRRREFAIRTALGATRVRLLQQFVTEGLILSAAAGVLGVAGAWLGVKVLLRAYPSSVPRTSDVTIDPVVLLFAAAVVCVTSLLFGLTPLLYLRMPRFAAALSEGIGRQTAGTARHHTRRALVVTEIAIAVVLTSGAGLLLRTVYNLAHVDAGFDRTRLITFSTTLSQTYAQAFQRAQLYQRMLERLRDTPGVQSATAMSGLPPTRPLTAMRVDYDNYVALADGPQEFADYSQNVMSDYFHTMGIPIVQGRGFEPRDAASSGTVVVVNETLAKTFWNGRNPIGQRLRPCCGDNIPWSTVIGVAKDVKQGGLDRKSGTECYWFVDQTAQRGAAVGTMNVVLRTSAPVEQMTGVIESVVRELDETLPVVGLRQMEDVFDESIQRPRLLAHLLGSFAGLALVLAAIGTYGLLSYMVVQRRREIGVRMALGADRSSVIAHVMKHGLVLTVAGVGVGTAAAFGLNRIVTSLLFGVQPTDASTFAAVVSAVTMVAGVATWLPAWRASRMDPCIVLRED